MQPPLSIQLYTLRNLMANGNHLPVLKKLSEIGFKGVEGFGYGMTATDFRAVVENLGMVVSSYFGGFPTLETVNEFIDTAAALGTNLTVSGLWIEDFNSVDAIKSTAEKVNSILAPIQDAGMSFSMHNHWMEFEPVEGRLAIEWLLEQCPGLTLELDVYWAGAHGLNTPEEMVAKFKSITPLMHMKDGSFIKGEPHTAVGKGKQNVANVMASADPAVLKWVILELDECATDMMEAVEQSYEYLVGNGFCIGNR